MKTFMICIACMLPIGLFGQSADLTYAYRANGVIIATEAPRHEGTFYRVELLKTPHFNDEDPALKTLKEFGTLRTEYLIDQKLTRILLGDYFDIEKARTCLKKVRKFGLNDARIVRYSKGYRIKAIDELEL